MIRRLLIVFASALGLAFVCLAGAWAIGGRELVANGGWTFDSEGGDSGPHIKRALAFDPATPMAFDVPVNFEFTRGDKVSLTVSGRPRLINALRWENGRLFHPGSRKFEEGSVSVRLTAPTLPRLAMHSAGNFELNGVDQGELVIEMAGAGNVEASGKVDRLAVDASGAGNIDFEKLLARDADITLAGFGNADISATGTVNADIAGAGNVTLHRKPLVLHSNIAGLGSVDHAY